MRPGTDWCFKQSVTGAFRPVLPCLSVHPGGHIHTSAGAGPHWCRCGFQGDTLQSGGCGLPAWPGVPGSTQRPREQPAWRPCVGEVHSLRVASVLARGRVPTWRWPCVWALRAARSPHPAAGAHPGLSLRGCCGFSRWRRRGLDSLLKFESPVQGAPPGCTLCLMKVKTMGGF